jgi:hypothetical protein
VIGSYSLIYPILLSACVMILNIFFIVAFINHHEEHKRSDMDLSQVGWVGDKLLGKDNGRRRVEQGARQRVRVFRS